MSRGDESTSIISDQFSRAWEEICSGNLGIEPEVFAKACGTALTKLHSVGEGIHITTPVMTLSQSLQIYSTSLGHLSWSELWPSMGLIRQNPMLTDPIPMYIFWH